MSEVAAGAVRIFRDAIIVGRCIDCGETLTGELGIRAIFPDEGPGLEIMITNPKRNEIHPIARVPIHDIPVYAEHALPLPPAGSA
jgi:hypothetical protein